MLKALLDLFFPRYCTICNRKLNPTENMICVSCNYSLPRLHFHSWTCNKITDLFENVVQLRSAACFMRYTPKARSNRLLWANKYNGLPNVGVSLGRLAAIELSEKGFFQEVDCLIPVPLSKKRLRERGYNQSETICKGIAEYTGIPLSTGHLLRSKHTQSQIGKGISARKDNVRDAFCVVAPEALRGKHVLLVDDVLTTGATMMSCAKALKEDVGDIDISVFAVATVLWDIFSSFDSLDMELSLDDLADFNEETDHILNDIFDVV